MFVSLVALTSMAFAFECTQPIKPEAVDAALQAAESAYEQLDEAGFRDDVNELAGVLLPCVTGALPKSTVARYHFIMGLHLSAIGDEAGAKHALDAAKLTQPDFAVPDLLPSTHPLRVHWDASEPATSTRKVPEPKSGSIAFDGVVGRKRPKTLPTLAQRFDEQGLAESTTYLAPRESLPPYRAIPRQRTTLILSSGAAMAVAGTLYGLAWATQQSLYSSAQDPSFDPDQLKQKRARTNALVAGSTVFLTVGIGTGVGAALIGER